MKKKLSTIFNFTPILFLFGGMLVYYLVMPLAIKFFLSFETMGQYKFTNSIRSKS